jgi:hypothetical protein
MRSRESPRLKLRRKKRKLDKIKEISNKNRILRIRLMN